MDEDEHPMTVLPLHIAAGSIAIVAGFVAVFALKGAKLHRRSGMLFVYSMLVLSLTGAVIGALKAQRINAAQGVLTFYLVTTAMLTVRHRVREGRWIELGTMLIALTVGLYELTLGLEALHSPRNSIDGVPAGMVFLFATVALVAASGDIRMLLGRGLQGAPRIARHLWRMCFALFIASASFFLGQAKVIPKPIRILPLLAIPALLPLVLMLYWLARVSLTQWYRRRVLRTFTPTLFDGSVR
jgi:uncharacterized membrane protein